MQNPKSKINSGRLFVYLLLGAMIISGCSDSNFQATFSVDTGTHPANWVSPLAIGRNDFHAGGIKIVVSTDQGAVLFGQRCAICHGIAGAGKVGPPVSGADAASVQAAINVIPLMKGQSDLTPADVQTRPSLTKIAFGSTWIFGKPSASLGQ